MKIFSVAIDKPLKAGEIISSLITDILKIECYKILNGKSLDEFISEIDKYNGHKVFSVSFTKKSMLITMDYPQILTRRFAIVSSKILTNCKF